CSRRSSRSFGSIAATCMAISFASSRKSGLRATKSVSLESSTIAPIRPPACTYASTTPSLASRSAFSLALASPRSLIKVFALEKSPFASSSALLQSITPAPVSSRRRLTSSFEFAITRPLSSPPRPRPLQPALRSAGRRSGTPHPLPAHTREGCASRAARRGHLLADQLDRADRVIFRRDDHVDEVGVAVRVDHRDDRDLEPSRLLDCDVLAVRIDDEDRRGRTAQLAHAGEVAIEMRELIVESLRVLLGHRREVSALLALHQVVEALDPLLDRDEVREESAEPSLIDEVHSGALRFLGDRLLRLLLRADEEDLPAV